MSLNWLEINKVLEELELEDSFIQKIRQESYHNLILDLHRPGKSQRLLISLEAPHHRLHRMNRAVKKGDKPGRFLQLLRSRIQGYKLGEVTQLGSERIVKMSILTSPEPLFLYIRLWGGASNIFLTDHHNKIIDAAFRRPKKQEISGSYLLLPSMEPPRKDMSIRILPGEGDFNEKLEAFFQKTNTDEYTEELIQKVKAASESRAAYLKDKIQALEERSKESQQAQTLENLARLLLSQGQSLEPGAMEIELSDWETEDKILLPLDPRLGTAENAEKLFKKSAKLKNARLLILEELETRKAQLTALQKRLEQPLDLVPSTTLQSWLEELVPTQQKITSPLKSYTGLRFSLGAFLVMVGRNAKENESLLKKVKGKDLWLHTRDYAGGYVFIRKPPGKTAPLQVLLDAGQLAVHYSKGKGGGKVDLYYTEAKYLKKPKGLKKGMVLPTQEKNLTIDYSSERVKQLMEKQI